MRLQRLDVTAHIQMLDATQSDAPFALDPEAVATAGQLAMANKHVLGEAVKAKLVFVHEDLDAFHTEGNGISGTKTDVGRRVPFQDQGLGALALELFLFDSIFAGHEHHSDYANRVQGDSQEVLMGHGRIGSFFPPSEWELNKPLTFSRGARLFEVSHGANVASGQRWTLRTCVLELEQGAYWSHDNGGAWHGAVDQTPWVYQLKGGGILGMDGRLPTLLLFGSFLVLFVWMYAPLFRATMPFAAYCMRTTQAYFGLLPPSQVSKSSAL